MSTVQSVSKLDKMAVVERRAEVLWIGFIVFVPHNVSGVQLGHRTKGDGRRGRGQRGGALRGTENSMQPGAHRGPGL